MRHDAEQSRRRRRRRGVAAMVGLLLVSACGTSSPLRFSGPFVPHAGGAEELQAPPRVPWSHRLPGSDRPPWLPDPPVDPERHHVPDDGFMDALAFGARS